MKFLDHLENSHKGHRPDLPTEAERASRINGIRQTNAKRAARRAAEFERLSEEDQMLARGLVVPKDRAGRVAMAAGLRVTTSGRKRSLAQVGAIMGVSSHAVGLWEKSPEKDPTYKPVGGPHRPRPKLVRITDELPPDAGIPEFENFGAKMMRRRRRIKLTKAELARRMGVPVERVTEWESMQLRPTPSVYARIMDALK